MHKDLGALIDGLVVGIDPIGTAVGYAVKDKEWVGYFAERYAWGREYKKLCGHESVLEQGCNICYEHYHHQDINKWDVSPKYRDLEERAFEAAGVTAGLAINYFTGGLAQLFLGIGPRLMTYSDKMVQQSLDKKIKRDWERKYGKQPEQLNLQF